MIRDRIARVRADHKVNEAAAWLKEAEAAAAEFDVVFAAEAARWHQEKSAEWLATLKETRRRVMNLDLAGARRAVEVTQGEVVRLAAGRAVPKAEPDLRRPASRLCWRLRGPVRDSCRLPTRGGAGRQVCRGATLFCSGPIPPLVGNGIGSEAR